MIVERSAASYADTVERLIDGIESRGLTIFASIDHAAGAREAGMDLAEEEVVLFGSPRAGTPLMQSDRRIGIELPLRMLVWREGESVLVGYRDPRELSAAYDLAAHEATLGQMAALLKELAAVATGTTRRGRS
jgi:uncharacterized protein (DUF302 family)